MYGCNHSLSCISGSVSRIGTGLFGDVTRIGKPLTGAVSRIGTGLFGDVTRIGKPLTGAVSRIGTGLFGDVTRIGKSLTGAVSRIGTGLKCNVCLACSVGKVEYLRVNPSMVWLTPEMLSFGEFEIHSNVYWVID